MTKQDILDYFEYINIAYNNPNKYNDLSRMLDELLENQTRWIPVDEALPNESDYYIVAVLYDDGERRTSTEFFDKNDGFPKYCYYKIIAWMPLPEPYQGGKHTCSECIIKDTDACSRWNTEADEVACEDFVGR